jgi:hypothetical protein
MLWPSQRPIMGRQAEDHDDRPDLVSRVPLRLEQQQLEVATTFFNKVAVGVSPRAAVVLFYLSSPGWPPRRGGGGGEEGRSGVGGVKPLLAGRGGGGEMRTGAPSAASGEIRQSDCLLHCGVWRCLSASHDRCGGVSFEV